MGKRPTEGFGGLVRCLGMSCVVLFFEADYWVTPVTELLVAVEGGIYQGETIGNTRGK